MSEAFDRENVELRRRDRRVGDDTDRELEWSGVRAGCGCRLGRRRDNGIFPCANVCRE